MERELDLTHSLWVGKSGGRLATGLGRGACWHRLPLQGFLPRAGGSSKAQLLAADPRTQTPGDFFPHSLKLNLKVKGGKQPSAAGPSSSPTRTVVPDTVLRLDYTTTCHQTCYLAPGQQKYISGASSIGANKWHCPNQTAASLAAV